MKKYFFKLTEALFQAPKEIEYNELEHKILNESIRDIEIVVSANNIEEANIKVEQSLKEIISSQFSDYREIKSYKFGVSIAKIEDL